MSARRRSTRVRRDERGSVILLAIIMVIVVSVAGAAVLSQESSAGNVQKAYSTLRTVTLSAEQTADSIVNRLRGDSNAGVDSLTKATVCNDRKNFLQVNASQVFCEPDKDSGLNVGTMADTPPYSVLTLGGSAYTGNRLNVPSPLGGVTPAFPETSVTGFPVSSTEPYWYPFCDNFHDFQDGGSTRCEAGLFIGRNVAVDSEGNGGLTILTNGSGTTAPIVRNNGAIVLSDSNGRVHTLNTSGMVQARRLCGYGHGVLDTDGTYLTSQLGSPEIRAGYNPQSGTFDNSHQLQCATDYASSTGAPFNPDFWKPNTALTSFDFAPTPMPSPVAGVWPQASPRAPTACTETSFSTTTANTQVPCMWADPDWVHEPIDPSLPAIDPRSVPRVDATAPAPYTLAPGSASTPCNATGYVVMPAAKAKDKSGNPIQISWTDLNGNAHSTQMYTAWYDDVTDLNAFMSGDTNQPGCKDTMYWFRPGVYYFDFLDVNATTTSPSTKWKVPNGGIPQDDANGAGQLVGGTPPGNVPGGWVPCGHGGDPDAQSTQVDVLSCRQPWKQLEPHSFQWGQGLTKPGLQTDDTDPSGSSCTSTSNPSAPAGAGCGEILDGQTVSEALSNAMTNDWSNATDFQSPIPQKPGADISSVDGLQFEVAYNLPSVEDSTKGANYCGVTLPTQCYKDSSVGNNSNGRGIPNTDNQGEGAELQVQIGGAGAGTCFIHLPPGDHTGLVASTPNLGSTVWHSTDFMHSGGSGFVPTVGGQLAPNQAAYPSDNRAIVVDLTNGCNPSVPGFEKVNSGCAPPPAAPTNCFPTAAGQWNSHPVWINDISAEFWAATATSTPNAPPGNGSKVFYDGIQMDAKWTGRPAPTYPNGCTTTGPGSQWIFGNASRIDWSQGTAAYIELCASKQSAWPGVTGNGADYALGIYGMSEDSAGPPPVWFSNKVDPTSTNINPNVSGEVPQPQPSVCGVVNALPACPASRFNAFGTIDKPTDPGYEPAGLSDVTAGRSIAYAWQEGKPYMLRFQLPNNYWDPITGRPQGSIECGQTGPLTTNDASDPPPAPPDNSCSPNTIPYGSVITNVTLKVHHREGHWNNPGIASAGVPTGGTFDGSCNNQLFNGSSCIANVRVKIAPGPGLPGPGATFGSDSTGSNGRQSTLWNVGSESAPALPGDSLPISDPTDPNTHNGWRNWTWGNQTPNPTSPSSTGVSSKAAGNADSSDWSQQRDLTDALNSPEALAGATITWQVTPKDDGGGSVWHYMELDGIELKVTYRPAGSLRPLDSCMTIRPAWAPATFEGVGAPGAAIGWTWDSVNNTWAAPYNGGGHDWLDEDWGINPTSSSSPYKGDQSLGDLNGTSAGNGSVNGDKQDCAVVNLDESSGGTHSRLHVSGALYAPSAAFSLSGNSNDAPWATDAIVSRQLSALKWSNAAGQAAIGDALPPARFPRTVTIVVCDNSQTWSNPCPVGHIAIRARVRFDDQLGAKYGYGVNVLSWVRNPTS